MDSSNPSGVTSALPASWIAIGYLIEGEWNDGGVTNGDLGTKRATPVLGLISCLSVAIQRGNTTSVVRTFRPGPTRSGVIVELVQQACHYALTAFKHL
ncbi:hypothetical protein EVAR_89002_1 [Eumeta japonica]|uniref:Uncharacterized protein n=1 Tax=Eumeta variegata TaxID=151549 RepID=A0A4C1X815_EUMVA|nr:hypothetical protein EVAR_89002_1 [Eumeta japonica]